MFTLLESILLYDYVAFKQIVTSVTAVGGGIHTVLWLWWYHSGFGITSTTRHFLQLSMNRRGNRQHTQRGSWCMKSLCEKSLMRTTANSLGVHFIDTAKFECWPGSNHRDTVGPVLESMHEKTQTLIIQYGSLWILVAVHWLSDTKNHPSIIL